MIIFFMFFVLLYLIFGFLSYQNPGFCQGPFWVLIPGMQMLGHTPHAFPLLVADGLQWKEGGVRLTAQAINLVTGPGVELPPGWLVGPE